MISIGYDIYRIKTIITEEGGAVLAEAGAYVPRRDRRTRKTTHAELEDDLTYTASNLDRLVVSPEQIRLVARTFRDHLFTKIDPGRISKSRRRSTFAKHDSHADDIVKHPQGGVRQGQRVGPQQQFADDAGIARGPAELLPQLLRSAASRSPWTWIEERH